MVAMARPRVGRRGFQAGNAPNLASPGGVAPAAPLSSGGNLSAPPASTLSDFSPGALAGAYNSATNAANTANTQRYNDILGGYKNLQSQVGNQYSDLNSKVQGAFNTNAASILGGYNDRLNKGMGYLDGIGNQQKADLNTQYSSQGANIQQGMVNNGLAGTTAAATMQQGNTTQRENDMRRLQASLNNQYLGTYSGLSGDALQAQSGLNTQGTGLAKSMGESQIGAQAGIGQNQLNFQERLGQNGPDLSSIASLGVGLGRYGNNQRTGPQQPPPQQSQNQRGGPTRQPQTYAQAVASGAGAGGAADQLQQDAINAGSSTPDYSGGWSGGYSGSPVAPSPSSMQTAFDPETQQPINGANTGVGQNYSTNTGDQFAPSSSLQGPWGMYGGGNGTQEQAPVPESQPFYSDSGDAGDRSVGARGVPQQKIRPVINPALRNRFKNAGRYAA